MEFGKPHKTTDTTNFCPRQLVADLLRICYRNTGVMDFDLNSASLCRWSRAIKVHFAIKSVVYHSVLVVVGIIVVYYAKWRQMVQAMNAERRQMAADLWTKSTDLSHTSACRQHVTTSAIALYSARKLMLFYHPAEGRRLSRPRWLVIYPTQLNSTQVYWKW